MEYFAPGDTAESGLPDQSLEIVFPFAFRNISRQQRVDGNPASELPNQMG
jgi:hypothetical protein